MKYPASFYKRTEEYKYTVTIYKGSDKIAMDYYTFEGIKKMAAILRKENEKFSTYEVTPNGSCLDIRV